MTTGDPGSEQASPTSEPTEPQIVTPPVLINYPPQPLRALTPSLRQELFGTFRWRSDPQPDDPEQVLLLDDWAHTNIVPVDVPELSEIGIHSRTVWFHRKAARQLQALWKRWDKEGLLGRVLSFGGAYVMRLQRGSTTHLSAHAFGTAFDINPAWNHLGQPPPKKGSIGSVVELVPSANDLGFFWGGDFSMRLDGMHFEIAELLC